MSHDRYVVSFELAGKVYIQCDRRHTMVIYASKRIAQQAVRKIYESVYSGTAGKMAMITAVLLDFRVNRFASIPAISMESTLVWPGLTGIIVNDPKAHAWLARGQRPYAGPKVLRRRLPTGAGSRYNKENRLAYGN